MTPERQLEIKELIESCRKFGTVPHEVQKAMDEMMATIGALGEADYILNIDATWKGKNKEIADLRTALRMAINEIRDHNSEYHCKQLSCVSNICSWYLCSALQNI